MTYPSMKPSPRNSSHIIDLWGLQTDHKHNRQTVLLCCHRSPFLLAQKVLRYLLRKRHAVQSGGSDSLELDLGSRFSSRELPRYRYHPPSIMEGSREVVEVAVKSGLEFFPFFSGTHYYFFSHRSMSVFHGGVGSGFSRKTVKSAIYSTRSF